MPSSPSPAIVCLAHLGWDFVWQRPQQLLSRLAGRFPVLYVNEPAIDPAGVGEPTLARIAEGAVTALQPVFPDRPEIIGHWRDRYTELVRSAVAGQGWLAERDGRLVASRPIVLWFYTPIPAYLADQIPHDLIVHDVMDDLAGFHGAAPDLRQREAELLRRANLVFAGGRSLYEARRGRHPALHLFPSGVDRAHFAAALAPATPLAPDLAGLSRPILGYIGVIDERIDLDLVRRLAADHPAWSLVLVGPTAKIDPRSLPRLPNIHYAGQQPYARLPHFLRGFDVCLMPFALNAATRSISPTKALEYMAAERPIVSTPVPDVVANWPGAVAIASGAGPFAAAVAALLAEDAAQRAARRERQRGFVARGGWDAIAGAMGDLIEAALARAGEARAAPTCPSPGNAERRAADERA